MATFDDRKVEEIVARVVERLAPALERGARTLPTPAKAEGCAPNPPSVSWRAQQGQGGGSPAIHRGGRRGVYDDVDSAVKAARVAHETLVDKLSMAQRDQIIAAIRKCSHDVVNDI